MDQKKIGIFLKEKLKEKGIKQKELAEKLGITEGAVSQALNGNTTLDVSNMIVVSELLGITLDEIYKAEIKVENDILFKKLSLNDVSFTKKEIANGLNILKEDNYGNHLIILAIENDNEKLVEYIIEYAHDLDYKEVEKQAKYHLNSKKQICYEEQLINISRIYSNRLKLYLIEKDMTYLFDKIQYHKTEISVISHDKKGSVTSKFVRPSREKGCISGEYNNLSDELLVEIYLTLDTEEKTKNFHNYIIGTVATKENYNLKDKIAKEISKTKNLEKIKYEIKNGNFDYSSLADVIKNKEEKKLRIIIREKILKELKINFTSEFTEMSEKELVYFLEIVKEEYKIVSQDIIGETAQLKRVPLKATFNFQKRVQSPGDYDFSPYMVEDAKLLSFERVYDDKLKKYNVIYELEYFDELKKEKIISKETSRNVEVKTILPNSIIEEKRFDIRFSPSDVLGFSIQKKYYTLIDCLRSLSEEYKNYKLSQCFRYVEYGDVEMYKFLVRRGAIPTPEITRFLLVDIMDK